MTLTPTCRSEKLYAGKSITFLGYTIKNLHLNYGNSIAAVVYGPDGNIAYGISEAEPAAFFENSIMSIPSLTAPIVSFYNQYIGYDDIEGVRVGYAMVKMCWYSGSEQPPPPPTTPTGPDLVECVFPELSLNFISVMSGLASWLGCMIRNIIVLIKWIVDWILHFPDHLDAWISRLFGVDPSLPFFDEVLKKIDIWISGKFGVDPEKPFWEELVKKALEWMGLSLDTAAENRMRERKW